MDYDIMRLFILVWGAALIVGYQLKKGIESIKMNLTINNLHVPDGKVLVQDEKFSFENQDSKKRTNNEK